VQTTSLQEIAHEIQNNRNFLESRWQDLPARQVSLRVVFDYTWKNLSASEKTALARLAVFKGKFSARIAEEAMSIPAPLFSQFQDRSLLRQVPGNERCEMLEVLRLYILEQAGAEPEQLRENEKRHCQGYAAFLKGKWDELNCDQQKRALLEIEDEQENIRTAWAWAVANQQLAEISAMHSAWARYLDIAGHYYQAEKAYGQAVQQLGGADQDPQEISAEKARLLGRLLLLQVWFCRRLGLSEKAAELLYSAGKLINFYQDPFETAMYKQAMAGVALNFSSYSVAALLFEESIQAFRELGKIREAGVSLLALATITPSPDAARQYYQESLSLLRSIGDARAIGACLNNLAHAALEDRNAQEARQLARESLQIAQSLGDRLSISVALSNLGSAYEMLGQYEEAVRCHKTTLEIYSEMGTHNEIIDSCIQLGRSYTNLRELGKARQYITLALRRITSQPVLFSGEVAQALLGIAYLYQAEHRLKRAVELTAFLLKINPIWKQICQEAEELHAGLAAILPQALFAQAEAKGRAHELSGLIAELQKDLGSTRQDGQMGDWKLY
jgi:tetratricopeptide (TPR) repeat protein